MAKKKKSGTVYDELPTHIIDVDEIEAKDRIRQDMGGMKDIQELAESLHDIGQLQPIILEEGNLLRAGGRRYAAALYLRNEDKQIGGNLSEGNPRQLPKGKILAVLFEELDEIQRLKIELDENRKRKDFNKAEESLGLRRLEEAMSRQLGRKVTGGELAEATGYSKAHITMARKVAKAIEDEGITELIDASSIFGAYRQLGALSKIKEIKERSAKINKVHGKDIEDLYKIGDGVKWLSTIEDESVDFINFDPPWGIGLDTYDRGKKYEEWEDDKVKSWDDIILPSIPDMFRVLREDSWAIVWFGVQYYEQLRQALDTLVGTVKSGKGFKVYPVPSIWYKTDKRGSQNDPSRSELDVYEAFFKIAKGDPRLFKTGPNVYPYPMPSNRIHFAQKNTDMCVDILERYTFGKMKVIDPTAGSGAIFKAAIRLGRNFEGRDISEENVTKSVEWLKYQEL